MTAAEYMRALEDRGWFTGLPDAARERVSREVSDAVADGSELWNNIPTPLDEEDVEDPLSLLAGLAEASYGLFQPSEARQTLG